MVGIFTPKSFIWYSRLLSNGLLACGCQDGTLILLDTHKNIEVNTFNHFTSQVRVIKELRNGDIIAGSRVGELLIIDLQTGSIKKRLQGHYWFVLGIVELNSSFILSGGYDFKLILWDLVNDKSKEIIDEYPVLELILLRDGNVAAAYDNQAIKIFDPYKYVSSTSPRQFIPLAGDSGAINRLELINNTLLASASGNGDVLIWDLETYTRIYTLKGHTGSVFTLKKINEQYLASGSSDNTIKIWNIRTGQLVTTLYVDVSRILSLEITGNGFLASSTINPSLKYFFINYRLLN